MDRFAPTEFARECEEDQFWPKIHGSIRFSVRDPVRRRRVPSSIRTPPTGSEFEKVRPRTRNDTTLGPRRRATPRNKTKTENPEMELMRHILRNHLAGVCRS
jgi:hypothetical protein